MHYMKLCGKQRPVSLTKDFFTALYCLTESSFENKE